VQLIADLTADQIFTQYVRHIGIGAIAAAGIIGIIKSSGVIKEAFTKGFQEMFSKSGKGSKPKAIERTDRDMKMSTIIIILVSMAVVLFIFFRFSILGTTHAPLTLSLIALAVVLIISFLFTSVAARAIAIVGTNPVSGMTLMTLILTSVIMVAAGLKGPYGMMASLLIGGVVCTALSVAGAFVTDLKIGYWIGATPWNQERFKFLGVIVSALAATLVIILLNQTEGFVKTAEHPNPLPAPQANAMAAILKAFMSAEAVPWILFGVGIAIAIFIDVIRIPSLAFALGMYIPQEYNIPLMIGGFVSYLLVKKAKDKATGRARREKGTLIASGFIAGGAIMGVVSALIKLPKWDEAITMHIDEKWFFQPLALLAFLGVLAYLYFNSKRTKSE
jgi:putative OPT family oligopeptide transporter